MNIKELITENPTKSWKWAAIVLACLLFLQTCSKCSHTQNAAFSEKNHIEHVDSLNISNKQLQDSILILRGNLQTCTKATQDLQQENDHLRDALKQSQSKPVIIYKDENK